MKAPSKTKTKKIAEPLLHRAVQYKLAMFLQHYPPREFNREFRNMFIGYLASHNGTNYRMNREMIIEGIWDLIRVLDEAEDRWSRRDCDEIISQYHGRKLTES